MRLLVGRHMVPFGREGGFRIWLGVATRTFPSLTLFWVLQISVACDIADELPDRGVADDVRHGVGSGVCACV